MIALSHFLLGFIVSFIGSIPPASINLLVINIASTKGIRKAMAFSTGAVFIELSYSFIAILCSKFLLENKSISQAIEILIIPVFLLLGYFSITKKTVAHPPKRVHKGSEFKNGLFMGMINPLLIPFWVAYSSYFISIGWLKDDILYIAIFVLGICLGTLALLLLFAYYSKKWFYGNTTWNGNLISKLTGWVFIILAVIHAIKFFIK